MTDQRSVMVQDLFYAEGDCGDLVLERHMFWGADVRQTKQLWQHAPKRTKKAGLMSAN
jgi:hypothetical protein